MLYRSSPKRLLAGRMTLGSHHYLLAGSSWKRVPEASFPRQLLTGPKHRAAWSRSTRPREHILCWKKIRVDRDHPLWNRRLFVSSDPQIQKMPKRPRPAPMANTGGTGEERGSVEKVVLTALACLLVTYAVITLRMGASLPSPLDASRGQQQQQQLRVQAQLQPQSQSHFRKPSLAAAAPIISAGSTASFPISVKDEQYERILHPAFQLINHHKPNSNPKANLGRHWTCRNFGTRHSMDRRGAYGSISGSTASG